jgi:succinoglycan biosynthesis protein ExoM
VRVDLRKGAIFAKRGGLGSIDVIRIMTEPGEYITVCVCTYKRPEYLAKLLGSLETQQTRDCFQYSIVVVDNDKAGSGKPVVEAFCGSSDVHVEYCCEPEQNIALARNRAVAHAKGGYVAFIDDDEFAEQRWLLSLWEALEKHRCDGVLGPVLPHFDHTPPTWFLKGHCFEDKFSRCASGAVLNWRQTRTGNVLLRRSLFDDPANWFNPALGSGGEDKDLFRRSIAKGYRFVWCDEARVYETVPPERCGRITLLRRALLRGRVSLVKAENRVGAIMKSVVAVPAYTVALPVMLMLGQHFFMKYLIKVCDHLGRLLAACGINVIKERYIFR